MQVTFICIRSLICWRRSRAPCLATSCTRRPQLRWATRFWHPGLGDWWGARVARGDLFRLLNFKVPVCGADLWLRVNFCRGAILKWDMKSGNGCGFKDKICSCIAKEYLVKIIINAWLSLSFALALNHRSHPLSAPTIFLRSKLVSEWPKGRLDSTLT